MDERKHRCKTCKAPAGQPCVTLAGKPTTTHLQRFFGSSSVSTTRRAPRRAQSTHRVI